MAITGRTIVLEDKDGNAVFPETSSEAIYTSDGEILQDKIDTFLSYQESADVIELQKPEMIQKVDNIETKVQEVKTQLAYIVEYECDNESFLDKIGSNRTLILTEDINITNLHLNSISNLTITSKNYKRTINIIGLNYWDVIVMKNCENIIIDNVKVKHDNCESSSIFIHSLCSNITINNCYISSKLNGIGTGEWLDSTSNNMIKNITISNNTFKVGRMCIELMNRGDIVRCKNVNIYKNSFEWGSAIDISLGESLAISLVGKQEGNTIRDNLFDSSINGYWAIEIACGIGTLIEGNVFIGKALYSIHFTFPTIEGLPISSNDCVISNNICIQNNSSTHAVTLRNVNNSIIKGNKIGTLRLLENSSYNLISDNNLLGGSISGVIEFGSSSRRNKSTNNILRCTHTDKACRGIFASGEGTEDNISTNDTVILPLSATSESYFQQITPATNNNAEIIKGYLE